MTARLYDSLKRPAIFQTTTDMTLQHIPGSRPCPTAPTPSFYARKATYSAAIYGYTLSKAVSDVNEALGREDGLRGITHSTSAATANPPPA